MGERKEGSEYARKMQTRVGKQKMHGKHIRRGVRMNRKEEGESKIVRNVRQCVHTHTYTRAPTNKQELKQIKLNSKFYLLNELPLRSPPAFELGNNKRCRPDVRTARRQVCVTCDEVAFTAKRLDA
eukprot:GHVU01039242.1.p2 GENE.GHVU01039242.1~~GHVU01039242.1.p2  ORF type:complete len:126 (+),score=13.24 GHVU01039242.1:650-1027(+)